MTLETIFTLQTISTIISFSFVARAIYADWKGNTNAAILCMTWAIFMGMKL